MQGKSSDNYHRLFAFVLEPSGNPESSPHFSRLMIQFRQLSAVYTYSSSANPCITQRFQQGNVSSRAKEPTEISPTEFYSSSSSPLIPELLSMTSSSGVTNL